jgi:serine/threonine protein kinase/tetratricopeptide (TPR) repeat protein
VGRYLVLERLGAGGMGEVYAAFDPQLNRRVAIKLLLPGGEGSDRGESRVRLMREAQAMARLSHPHVLPVYDIGEHGDRVFIALELVEGSTLRQWLKEQPRPWREVVHTLALAGQGLAAAHAAGLVHRDFKPDNVLVGRDGRVLVYDFGLACEQGTGSPGAPPPVDLARILRSEPISPDGSISGLHTRDPLETPVTRAGLIMGTPGYMAPEQYRQEAVTARADQFSFCATLYYALYGEHAFEGHGAAGLARGTLEGRLRPAPRDSRVPGWLRQRVLKGLNALPQERYVSMEALLESLQDDPRVRRQRRLLVSVAAALLMGLGVKAVGEWHQRQRLCQDANGGMDGVWDATRARAVEKAFLATGQPYAATTLAGVKSVLDTYASQWVDLQRRACVATRLRGEASEELFAARTACLERRRSELKALTHVLSEPDTAVVEHAGETVRALSELGPCADVDPLTARVRPPADPQVAARVEQLRASLSHARALRFSGRFEAGLALAEPVVNEARTLGYRPLEAEALLELGQLQGGFGDREAERTLKEALWRADEAGFDEVRAEVLVALTQQVAYDATRVQDGHDWFHQARALLLRTRRQGRLLARLESAHGLVHAAEGDAAAAEASQRNALAALRQVYDPETPEAGMVLRRLGSTLSAQGRYAEALEVYRQAHTLFVKTLGAEHPRVGRTLMNIGTTLSALGQHAEALEPLRQGVDLVRRTLSPGHPLHAKALSELGAVLGRQGKTDEALEVLRRAVGAAEKGRGPEHPDVALPCNTLGQVLVEAGRPTEALGYFERALRLRESKLGSWHPELAFPLTGQGEALLKLGRPAEALGPLERALTVRLSRPVPAKELAETRFALARALWESRGDMARARRLAQEAERALVHPGTESLRARIQAWLDSHTPRG